MQPERWHEIERLFNAALELPDHERDAFLGEQEIEEGIRRRIAAMLDAARAGDSRLDHPPAAHTLIRAMLGPPPEGDRVGYLSPGETVGAYRIERFLAAGGMGAVYLARESDGPLERPVAVKLLRAPDAPGVEGAGRTLQRFRREWRALSSLTHPSIPHLLNIGATADGSPYLAMEYVDGTPIDRFCADRSLSIRERVALCAKVCDAVQHAHQNLVLHRDIKPSNVLVTDNGLPKVLDFGIARLLDEDSHDPRLTRTGEFLGTIAFASPEQLRGDTDYDTRSDVYSLGVLLYKVLGGSLPHEDTGSLPALIRSIEQDRPTPPSSRNHEVGADLDAIVLKAISREPDRRYRSAGDLGDDLRRWIAREPIVARADSRWYVLRSELRRRRTPVTIALIVVLGSLAFGVYARYQSAHLAEQNRRLERASYIDSFQRGRLLGRSGNLVAAEELFWALRDKDERDVGTPGLAIWGVRELYEPLPLRSSLRLPFVIADRACPGPDGSIVVVDENEHSAMLVDTESERFRPLAGVTGVASIAASHDGEYLAWAGQNGSLRFARTRDPDAVSPLDGAPRDVSYLAVAPDGSAIGALSHGSAHVFNRKSGEWTTLVAPPGVGAARIEFLSPTFLVGVCNDGVLRRWSTAGGEPDHEIRSDTDPSNFALAVSPDTRSVLIAGAHRLTVCDTESGSTSTVEVANGWVKWACFAGEHLAVTFSADYALRVWTLDPLRLDLETIAHAGNPAGLIPSGDGRTVVSLDRSSLVRVWSFAGHEPTENVTDLGPGTILALDASDDDTIGLAIADSSGRLAVLDRATGGVITTPRFDDAACAVRAIPHEDDWVVATYGGRLARYHQQDDRLVERWSVELADRPNQITLSPDAELLAVACDGGALHVRRVADGSEEAVVPIDAVRVPSAAWSPDGREIIACTLPESDVLRVRTSDYNLSTLFDGQRWLGLRAVAITPSGDTFAVAGDDARIRIWRRDDSGAWRPDGQLVGHVEGLFALAFSPDGGLLGSAGRSGSVVLWDMDTRTPIDRVEEHDGMVFGLQFADGTHRLLSGGLGARLIDRNLAGSDERVSRCRPDRRALPAE